MDLTDQDWKHIATALKVHASEVEQQASRTKNPAQAAHLGQVSAMIRRTLAKVELA